MWRSSLAARDIPPRVLPTYHVGCGEHRLNRCKGGVFAEVNKGNVGSSLGRDRNIYIYTYHNLQFYAVCRGI